MSGNVCSLCRSTASRTYAGGKECGKESSGVFSGLLASGLSPAVVAGLCDRYVRFLSTSGVDLGRNSRFDGGGSYAFENVVCDVRGSDTFGCGSHRVVCESSDGDEESSVCVSVDKSPGACGADTSGGDTTGGGGDFISGNTGGVCSNDRVAVGTGDGAQSCGIGSVKGKLSEDPVQPSVVGRWAASNRRKKEKRKARQSVPSWRRNAAPLPLNGRQAFQRSSGFCETVVSGSSVTPCPSYGQALSDAEREARDTLAQRRAAENKVAKKLAEMKLASLEDEKKCQEYADLKHQRVVQWTNEATAKSQQSLEKCKSIDPSSSASQYEIRQQAKALADSEATVRALTDSIRCAFPDSWQEVLEACKPCGTTEFELAAAGGGY